MNEESFARSPQFWRQMRRAVWVGALTGLSAAIFLGVVHLAENLIFGDAHPTGFFEGPVWLIALLGAGGLLVGWMRQRLHQPAAGSTVFNELAEGRVDPAHVPGAVAVSAVSLAAGAPLGPEAALGSIGGGLGTWASERAGEDEEQRAISTQAGVGGAFGALISPLVSALLALELEKKPKARLGAMVPTVTAAVVGFAVFFPIAGDIFFGLFEAPSFELRSWHLFAAIGVGLLAAVVAVVMGLVMQLSTRAMAGPVERHPMLVPAAAGALAGAVIFAVPLAGFSGAEESRIVISEREQLAVGLMLAAVAAKIIATSAVFSTGFVGGPIFPMLFVGGTSGAILSVLIPGLPPGIAITGMMAAVPAPLMGLPISATFMVSFVFGLGAQQAVPAGIAALTSLVVVRWVLEGLAARTAPTAVAP